MSRVSMSNCLTIWNRLAPSAVRIAISRSRPAAPGKKKIGHVRAGDKQDQRDRRAQDEERGPHVADGIGLEIDRACRAAGVSLGILPRELGRDCLQIRRRRSQRDPGFQSSDDGKKMCTTVLEVVIRCRGKERLQRRDWSTSAR